MIRRAFQNITANLWRRHCPDVLVRRLIGDVAFTISLRDHALWALRGADAVAAEKIPWPRDSVVWDLGCNIGVFSAQAAALGNRVIAFDISPTNIEALRRTINSECSGANNLTQIVPVLSPVTVTPRPWSPAPTGHPEEAMTPGRETSLGFLEAAAAYGLPQFIKMDIQGGEAEFLQSIAWRQWLQFNRITWFLEIHPEAAKHVWGALQQVDASHFIFRPA